MNIQMAYLVGMVLGNGEIQKGRTDTTVTIDIPCKNLYTDDMKDVKVYVKASIVDIRSMIEPLIGHCLTVTETEHSIKMSFSKNNDAYVISELIRLIGGGTHHSTMKMNEELFSIKTDEKKALLRGIADVTGYIRRSNEAREKGSHRVYIEVPKNWDMVIDVANMLKEVDVPIETINFGHPNFRDPKLKDYDKGKQNAWKREHQIKIYANEFLIIGFNIKHKQEALEKLSSELLKFKTSEKTHRYYWEKRSKIRKKAMHPREVDESLPVRIRGKHFDSWKDLAEELGYGD